MEKNPAEEKPYEGMYTADCLSDLFNRDHFAPANVIELPRKINGDFSGLARKIAHVMNIPPDASVEFGRNSFSSIFRKLQNLGLTAEETLAAQQISRDLGELQSRVPSMHLRINRGDAYAKHDSGAAFRFHVDGSARILCNYNEPTAQWLHIGDEIPDAEMMKNWGYAEYFEARPNAGIYALKPGNIYHFLGLMNTTDTPPFVHRGMASGPDDPPRLLLVGEYDESPEIT